MFMIRNSVANSKRSFSLIIAIFLMLRVDKLSCMNCFDVFGSLSPFFLLHNCFVLCFNLLVSVSRFLFLFLQDLVPALV